MEFLLSQDGVTKSGVGWHCSVCDCFLKDSMTYLDHINGRKHQRKLGYSMRVERSTKDQMLGRLTQLTKEKERAETKSDIAQLETDYSDVVKAKDENEAEKKAERARKRKELKQKKKAAQAKPPTPPPEEEEEEEEEVEEEGVNPDVAAMMGFSGFGGNK
jgi:U4/U6.U5 tri-snRNP component SNU23